MKSLIVACCDAGARFAILACTVAASLLWFAPSAKAG
jgi:hypothetical protein